jgi:putative flippase GtrA
MKLIDIILAIICSEASALVLADFLKEYDHYSIIKWVLMFILPIICIVAFWLADLIKEKYKFVIELVKYVFIGVLAVLLDLKVFALLIWLVGLDVVIVGGFLKAISFLISVFAKFIGNKYWTFGEKSNKKIENEILKFVLVTFVGLIIDVGAFYYFSKILGPQFSLPNDVWVKVCVICAAIVAAAWNFLSYKFIVFKKMPSTADYESNTQNPTSNI